MRITEIITALDVQEGDVIRLQGYRVRVSGVIDFPGDRLVRCYRCHSIPLDGESPLPKTYEGMHFGGNASYRLSREISE